MGVSGVRTAGRLARARAGTHDERSAFRFAISSARACLAAVP